MTLPGDERIRLLFIARAYPPTLGGMENFAYWLSRSLREEADVTALVNRRGKSALPAFLVYALYTAPRLARKNRVQAIHLADALLAPLGVVLRKLTGLRVTCSVHGLDVTYRNRLYQAAVTRALAHTEMMMANSSATAEKVRAHAGQKTPVTVIRPGVNPLPQPSATAMQRFRQLAAIDSSRPVVLSVGRLVKRKGFAWFTERVLPRLPSEVTYVVIGEGKEMGAIRAAASAAGVGDRVQLLGRVSNEILAAAYRCTNVFVMPNIPVSGDIEGFGLVALEAAASGVPAVASRLEGITDAVQHGRNGLLVPPLAADEFVRTIVDLLQLPEQELAALGSEFATFTQEHYGWRKTARRYVDAIKGRAAVAPLSRAGEVTDTAYEP